VFVTLFTWEPWNLVELPGDLNRSPISWMARRNRGWTS